MARIILATIVAFLIVCISTIIIGGFFPIHHPLITNNVLKIAKSIGIKNCTMDEIVITPWKKIEIKGLDIKTNFNSNDILNMRIDYCKIPCNLFFVIIDRNLLMTVYSFAKDALQKKHLGTEIIQQRIKKIVDTNNGIRGFYCKGDKLRITNDGKNQLILSKYEIDTDKKLSQYDGTLKIRSVVVNEYNLLSSSGELTYKGGLLKIKNFKSTIFNSNLRAEGEFDIYGDKIKSLDCQIEGLKIDLFFSSSKKTAGNIQGLSDVKIKVNDSPFNADFLKYNCTVLASNVVLVNLPVQKALVSLLGFPQLERIGFDTIYADLEVKSGKNVLNEIRGMGPIIKFSSVGWFNTDGTLDQKIDGVLTSEFAETLPGIVSESMQRTHDNGRSFKCRIYGTTEHPKMELGKETLKKAISGAFDSMKKQMEGIITNK